ncbi:MAG: hypothetical protein ABWY58_16475 [Aeromicrobium sp.]
MRLLLPVVLVLLAGAGCSGAGDPDPVEKPLPEDVVMHIDQSRMERKGREAFVRIDNGTDRTLTVQALRLTSPRLPDVTWKGREVVGATYQGDVEIGLPNCGCGTDVDATVMLTYRLGDGPITVSTGPADDIYGAIGLIADRDCAQTTLTTAADVTVGDPTVDGEGMDSVLRLPVTLAPTGASTDVRFAGFESTVLFRQTADSPADVSVPLDADDPVTKQVLSVVPTRCDPHALAEDKVGTLFGVRVRATGLSDDAEFYLPLTRAQRTALHDFFGTHCGFSRP